MLFHGYVIILGNVVSLRQENLKSAKQKTQKNIVSHYFPYPMALNDKNIEKINL